jgi:DNA-directed RNA polymerase subunit RPC12/RpoP
VDKKGIVNEGEKAISHLGVRKSVLNDLSTAATFIAYNYNTPINSRNFEQEAKRILAEVEKECGWMYETWHPNADVPNRVKGIINYTVWSDVYRCPQCSKEMVFWDVTVNKIGEKTKEIWDCPSCGSVLSKNPRKNSNALRVERVIDTVYDRSLGGTIRQARQVPVLINYSVKKKRFVKRPDNSDKSLINDITNGELKLLFPINELPRGFNTQQPWFYPRSSFLYN